MLGNFEFVEIALTSLLNQQQVNALLDLFAHVTQGAVQVMLKNDVKLCKFSRVKVKVPYKKEECTFEAHIHPLWEWALDILENPFLGTTALSMNVFMMSPGPEIIGGIFRLRTFQVPEDAEEEGKLGYTTLKHVIWHKSFKKLLLEIEQYLKTGCMVALTHGHSGKCPCPVYDQSNIASFLRCQNLTQFNQVIHVTFSDGNKLADISKQIFYAGINVLKKSTTPEGSTSGSMLFEISAQRVLHATIALGPTKVCISQSEMHMNTVQMVEMFLLRLHVDHLEKSISGESDPEVDAVSEHTSVDHIKLGAHVVATQTLKDLEENGQPDMAFHWFCQRSCKFLNDTLLAYGYQVKSWISLPADFTVKEYHYLLVNYESTVTWNQCTDHLCCNPSFFDIGNMEFILAQPFMTRIGLACTIDCDLRLKHVKTVPQAASIFIPLCLIIQGAVLAPDTEHDDEFFVVEQLDSDMFLWTQVM
ncbi:hypothetical protein F5J12DRAFT_786626 [Pisolithus orientalis]|uniref:uncharacterized protein n=1 Tax=Pisolithus orientalis TaxID=936130 RepID=UPI0022252CB8|nr:uncharacterized protein F5J12DRAFT_786626 [Pisolithus orientalis]KAI5989827.1 hypothetical protein F5J12DRAFT_786626 [Pisolithus orientalis]